MHCVVPTQTTQYEFRLTRFLRVLQHKKASLQDVSLANFIISPTSLQLGE